MKRPSKGSASAVPSRLSLRAIQRALATAIAPPVGAGPPVRSTHSQHAGANIGSGVDEGRINSWYRASADRISGPGPVHRRGCRHRSTPSWCLHRRKSHCMMPRLRAGRCGPCSTTVAQLADSREIHRRAACPSSARTRGATPPIPAKVLRRMVTWSSWSSSSRPRTSDMKVRMARVVPRLSGRKCTVRDWVACCQFHHWSSASSRGNGGIGEVHAEVGDLAGVTNRRDRERNPSAMTSRSASMAVPSCSVAVT